MPATQAAADSCLSAPKGATPPAAIGTIASTASPNVNAGISGRRATRPTTSSHAPRRQLGASVSFGPGTVFGRSRTDAAAARTITRKSISDARAEWVSQQPVPSRIRPSEPSRERLPQLPHRPLPSAQPCRTCSRRRRCRRCDGTTLPPRDPWPIQPISRSPPPTRPQPSRRRPRKCSSPQRIRLRPPQRKRRRQSRPHRCRSCFW